MAKFRFPRNPGVGRENPFQDERGENRFADEAPQRPIDENPFSTSVTGDVQPYKPEGYEPFLAHRSRVILALGAIGLAVVALGVLGALVGGIGAGEWVTGIFYCLPVHLLGLAIALPAWIMGRSDLAAIHAGAMDARGRRGTKAGLVMGIVGTLVGVLPIVFFLAILLAGLFGW